MNSVRNRLHSGNPRSTTNREDRYTTNIALHTRTPITRPLHHNLRTVTGTQLSDSTIPNCLIQPYPSVWSNHTQVSDPTIPSCLIQPYPAVWSNHTQLSDPTIPNCLIQPYPTVWSNHTQLSDPTIPSRPRVDTSRCSRQFVRPPLRPRHRMARRYCCVIHLRWQRARSGRVLLTDESKFSLKMSLRSFRRR